MLTPGLGRGFFVVLLLLLARAPTFATISDSDLQAEYEGKVLTLRHFYPGEHLRFDCSGNGIGAGATGVWDVEGQLRVTKISLSGGAVHIRGARVFSFYDPETKQMRDVASVTKKEAKAKHLRKDIAKWAAGHNKVEVDVECEQAPATMSELSERMNAVFLGPQDSFNNFIPAFWRSWFERDADEPAKKERSAVTRVGGGVKAPRALSAQDPEYSGIAKLALYQATTVLWLVVDPSGMPTKIHIQRPAGLGLDEQAIAAVQTWRFAPATKDGQPVAVQINVEVNFRLY